MAKNIKIVIVGDGYVGKTCLLYSLTAKTYTYEQGGYVPTVFDNYTHLVNYNGEKYSLVFWDTAGSVIFKLID